MQAFRSAISNGKQGMTILSERVGACMLTAGGCRLQHIRRFAGRGFAAMQKRNSGQEAVDSLTVLSVQERCAALAASVINRVAGTAH